MIFPIASNTKESIMITHQKSLAIKHRTTTIQFAITVAHEWVNIQYENINILSCYLQHTYLIKPISSYNHVSYYTMRCILFYSIRGMIPRIDAIYTCANKLRINLLFIYVYWSSIYTHIMPSRHMWALNDYFERE